MPGHRAPVELDRNVHFVDAHNDEIGGLCRNGSVTWVEVSDQALVFFQQYLTNLHLLRTCPRTAGRAESVPAFPLTYDALSLLPSPPPLRNASSENATSWSIQVHISHVRALATAPSRPFRGKRIISQPSVQQVLGNPEGKSANLSAAGTKTGGVKTI
jgi:hypothetical protein